MNWAGPRCGADIWVRVWMNDGPAQMVELALFAGVATQSQRSVVVMWRGWRYCVADEFVCETNPF